MSSSRTTSPWLLAAGLTTAITFVVILVSMLGGRDTKAPAGLVASGNLPARTHRVFPFPRSGKYLFGSGAKINSPRVDAPALGGQHGLAPPIYAAATSEDRPSGRLAQVAARMWLLPVRPIETAP